MTIDRTCRRFPPQGNIGSTNWGVNLLLEEGVVPEVVALAQHCEVLSVRGYVPLSLCSHQPHRGLPPQFLFIWFLGSRGT